MSSDRRVFDTVRHLYRHFYVGIFLMILMLLLILFQLLPFWRESKPVSVTLERYLIMITLIVTPIILRWFAKQQKKRCRSISCKDAQKRYRYAYYLRHYTLSTVTLFHIVLFGISRNMNFFWFILLLFTVFLYCRPSLQELEKITGIPAETESEERVERKNNNCDDTPAGK